MIKRFFAAFLAVCVMTMLASCVNTAEITDESTIDVYYVNSGDYREGGSFVASKPCTIVDNSDIIHSALEYLAIDPEEENLSSALIKGTRIYSYSLNSRVMEIDISAAYLMLADIEKAAVKCCLTLTLCNIDEIDSVSIYVDGMPVEEKLTSDIMILEDIDTNEFEKQILLYFPENTDRYLEPEIRVLTVGQDKLLSEYVVEELINSTQSSYLHGSIPEGTRLLSVEQHSGLCTVNFSSDFVNNRAEDSFGQRMTIYSIVNSLTHIEGINKVKFEIDGYEPYGYEYEYIDISDTFTSFSDIIYNSDDVYDILATVYLGLKDNGGMVETPVFIDRGNYTSTEENVVNYFIRMPAVGGYEALVPQTVSVNEIKLENGECKIDLNENLFSNGAGKAAKRAAYAIAAVVLKLGGAERVTISVAGEIFISNIRISDLDQ